MFPGIGRQDLRSVAFAKMTPELADDRDGRAWRRGDRDPPRGRQVVGGAEFEICAAASMPSTPMEITGPAAGHARMQTKDDPTGKRVLGMLNNCAGGVTPWGTWLTCEENFHGYFFGRLDEQHRGGAQPQALRRARQLVWPGASTPTASRSPRSRTSRTASAGSSRSIRSIRPRRRRSAPRSAASSTKAPPASSTRTAAMWSIPATTSASTMSIASSRTARVDTANPKANADILDSGTLSVARYNADGTLDWLPLVFGEGPLTAANGFDSQADVLIETRRAADLLGATKMDRPEDVEANPATQQGLCHAHQQQPPQAGAGRRRQSARRQSLRPHHRDDPARRRSRGGTSSAGRSWCAAAIPRSPTSARRSRPTPRATAGSACRTISPSTAKDGCGSRPTAIPTTTTGRADGIWGVETEGAARGTSQHFYRAPVGAELCGPCFTPDDETLFVAIQHPGEADDDAGPAATFENPSTRWPDFKPDMPPRPSIVAITRRGGGKIGV